MKFTYTILAVVLFNLTINVIAQIPVVKINSDLIGGEQMIAMNPKNTNQMVVGTHVSVFNSQSNMLYLYSSNGGLNWSSGLLPSTTAQPGADPVVLADTAGIFYYICVANWYPPIGDKLLCFKSTNGGANWNSGVTFAELSKFDDMPMGCIDFSNSQYRNSIYVTWTLFDSVLSNNPLDSCYVYFTKSTDAGSTFSTPKRISKIAGGCNWNIYTPEGPVPCTGINGEIYVCYPYNEQILFNRSADGGNVWLNDDIVVSSQPGGWCWKHSPVVACDLSQSQYRGNVYIVFSDLRNGINDRDIWLVKSTNSGNNWSNPVRVNNDSPGHKQELPWICVDPVTGYIWIVFYDSRNYTNNIRYDTYVARSTDGGNTFKNVRASNSSSWTFTDTWVGDYMSITAYNNQVRPVWASNQNYNFQHSNLFTAIIDSTTIGIRPISSDIPYKFLLYQNYPNPFNPSTNIRYQIPNNSLVSIKIYNVLGREIETLVNENLNAGTYIVCWNSEAFPSGVYFLKMTCSGEKNFSDVKKMVHLK